MVDRQVDSRVVCFIAKVFTVHVCMCSAKSIVNIPF